MNNPMDISGRLSTSMERGFRRNLILRPAVADLPTCRLADLPTCRLADLPTCETYRPAKFNSFWTCYASPVRLGGPVYELALMVICP